MHLIQKSTHPSNAWPGNAEGPMIAELHDKLHPMSLASS
jgi:hypothetical protein